MSKDSYDLAIIGGGPGGYVAAIRAAQLGLKAVCIEREHLGGICLNWGCIPTKALLRSSEMFHHINHLKGFGLSADNPGFDIKSVVKRSRYVAGKLNAGIKHLLKKNKVTVIEAEARLAGDGSITTTDNKGSSRSVSAANFIIATGARARELPDLRADAELIWTYKEAMTPESLPDSLLVIGSGAIGMEFASFYSDLGVSVTVVEMLDRILPLEDHEVSSQAQQLFEKQGMTIITSANVRELATENGKVIANIERQGKSETLTVDRAILAIGITGNVENLGLEEAGIGVEKGHIRTDNWGNTGIDGIWAIGDVTGPPWLAHKASHEAVVVVEKIAGHSGVKPLDKANIPACTYCRPQIASVGLTEQAAREVGRSVRTGNFPFMANGKAIALGETDGFVKTVFDKKTGELLGAHMIGAEVTEMIQGFAIARKLETTEAELMHTIFPHPTLSEMMHESVLDAFDRAIHF